MVEMSLVKFHDRIAYALSDSSERMNTEQS